MSTVASFYGGMIVRGAICLAAGITACGDISSELPTGVADPKSYATPDAARQQARYARYFFQLQLPAYVEATGLLTDELISGHYGEPVGRFSGTIAVDTRDMGETTQPVGGVTLKLFGEARRYTQQARQALAKYAPDESSLQGEIFALEGMIEVYMADAFCSGIPLSTVDFEQDFTYTSQLTTQQVYEHAIALFDTAIALGRDSANVESFGRTGKARALLALGRYEEADTVAAAVTDDFQYRLPLSPNLGGDIFDLPNHSSVASREGGTGLAFRSPNPDDQDPRFSLIECQRCNPLFSVAYYLPMREWWTIASATEARLIRAEAAIHRDDAAWLSLVNSIRTNNSFTVDNSSGTPDTLWHAGIGGVDELAPLRDPAANPLPPGKTAMDVRIDALFRERGFWLFLTGTRQGDLRRLVREYQRPQETVYPTGIYPGGTGQYGRDINFAIEQDEKYNPHFSRCTGRGA